MQTRPLAPILTLLFCVALAAQTPAASPNADLGTNTVTKMMDRPEVRIMRVEMLPTHFRGTHTHDDVLFHLYIPVSAKVELTIGSARPIMARPITWKKARRTPSRTLAIRPPW